VCWKENGTVISYSAAYPLTVAGNTTLTAEFAPIDTPSLSVSSVNTGSIALSWTPVAGAAWYQVWRNGAYFSDSASTGYTNGGLPLGQTYSYQVKAVCAAGSTYTYGNLSGVVSARTAPTTPSASAAATSYNKAAVYWSAVPGASGYEVYRSTSLYGGYKKIYTAKRASITSYSNSSLNTGMTYYYQVVAYATSGRTKVYGNYSAAASVRCSLDSVTGASASAYDAGTVKLSWKAVAGRSKYEIWRSTSPDSGFALVATSSSTSYKNSGLVSNVTYYYRVRAYRSSGGVRADGGFSATVSARPVLLGVTGASASAIGAESVKLSWKAVAGRTKYEIWRSTSPDSGFALVATSTSTSYKNSALQPNTTYYYRIRAYRQCGSVPAYGDFSATVSARPAFGGVTGASAVRASATSVKLSWGKVAGCKMYEVYRATSPDGPFTLVKATSAPKLTDSRLTTGVTYYYKVAVYCMVGKERYYGGESAVVSVTP
jgi:fibronectin type 3 domain-containing protein